MGRSITGNLSGMRCPRCHQHNPGERDECWNCGAPLASAREDEAGAAERSVAEEGAGADDTSDLGTLGPLRVGGKPERPRYPAHGKARPDHTPSALTSRQVLTRSITAGALTGGAAVALVFGLLSSAAGQLLEAGGVSRSGTTLAVIIAQGFIMGAVNGAIIGALSAYFGGGIWTGAVVGAALAAGMWFAQALFTGSILAVPAPVVAATLLMLGVVGAVMGALVGAVVESVGPGHP
jgi:hypothetical protein